LAATAAREAQASLHPGNLHASIKRDWLPWHSGD
jgi:hypothetical protein